MPRSSLPITGSASEFRTATSTQTSSGRRRSRNSRRRLKRRSTPLSRSPLPTRASRPVHLTAPCLRTAASSTRPRPTRTATTSSTATATSPGGQFLEWNPALNGNCNGLWLDTWYCVGAFDDLPLPPHETSKPTSGNVPSDTPRIAPAGTSPRSWTRVPASQTCSGASTRRTSSPGNPSVTGSCGNIQQEAWYCVGRPATPTTRTEGAPEPTGTEDAMPTQSGIAADCSEDLARGRRGHVRHHCA